MVSLKTRPPYKQITQLLLKLYGTFSNGKDEAIETQTVTTASKLPLCGSVPIYWNTILYLSNNINFGIHSFPKFPPSRLWYCVALQKWGASWFVCHTKQLVGMGLGGKRHIEMHTSFGGETQRKQAMWQIWAEMWGEYQNGSYRNRTCGCRLNSGGSG